MTILDTNVWVALFYSDDSLHYTAVAIKPSIIAPVFVPDLVLAETCTVLERTAGKINKKSLPKKRKKSVMFCKKLFTQTSNRLSQLLIKREYGVCLR